MDIAQTEIFAPVKKLTFLQRFASWWMPFSLLLSDILALSIALGLGLFIRHFFLGPITSINVYPNTLLGLLLVTISIYAFQGLYVIGGTNTVEELRSLSKGSSLAFLLLSAVTFLTQTSLQYSRFIFTTTWFLSLIFVPAMRWSLRKMASAFRIWGKPVLVIGNGEKTNTLVNYLSRDNSSGWHPVAIIGNHQDPNNFVDQRVPFYKAPSSTQLSRYIDLLKTDTIFILQDEVDKQWIDKITKPSHQHIRKIITVAGLEGLNHTNMRVHQIAGSLGIEIRQIILSPWGRFLKRALDIFLILLGGMFLLPFIGLIAILIKLDSRGSIFYAQTRIGFQGKHIRVWKFRTMIENADHILEEYLVKNPDLKAEWEANHKLKEDPRITRVGSILRKLSLDELPQLWNILRGEMSLIGPRPIVDEEIDRYGNTFELYACVLPGMTGLWQVSGRNNTTYEQRVKLDAYYVKNWSIWLDIYILIKTVWVVLSRDGAY